MGSKHLILPNNKRYLFDIIKSIDPGRRWLVVFNLLSFIFSFSLCLRIEALDFKDERLYQPKPVPGVHSPNLSNTMANVLRNVALLSAFLFFYKLYT